MSTQSEVPEDLKYAKSHEWARLEADGTVTVGISDHAQQALGDLVYVELPEVGQELEVGAECAVVESVKAASDIFSPASGKVTRINELLTDEPELVNKSPYRDGWLFKMLPDTTDNGMDELISASKYKLILENEE
ncbi:MAG: glycine cleavage system protein GcvH [Thiotrichaceae bacterium]